MGMRFDLKEKGWIWQVTMLSVVLGVLLAAALKTQQSVRSNTGIPTTRFSGLAQALLDEKDRNKLLQKEITDLRTKVDRYEQAQGEDTTQAKLLSHELQKAKLLAGLVPVEGPGLEVTVQDYPGRIPADTPAILKEEYLVHDLDLRNLVNELLNGGAEAVSISDRDTEQRIIATTAIRCVGEPILINQVEMSSPFTIKAVGPANGMETGLKMANGLLDNWRPIEGLSRSMVKTRKRDHIVISAYSGNTSSLFIWAKPVEVEGKPE